ncbi:MULTISPECIES: DUF4232 domain-containing protein [unclassified Streptomyces]|uniref:DUF4232 domain-containing protein n=1 Tax=unclassified Streptomyces TaxID=2593676 RepID=UPI0001B58472|nr:MULTISPECIES: DUF4232 domain-containing protein [unclassified Streptomyces]EFL01806.1 conserved hypothetical protein [Streptomyces sp. SPB78]MYR30468.1 DUF4232 domain-containing protein [Streptomyces sp. SID4945]SCF49874.1 Protein of unknown function [Streptomyces sp. LcepLS]
MRTFTRTRSLRTLAAALVAAGALSLTACSGEGSGVGEAKDAGPATAVSPASQKEKAKPAEESTKGDGGDTAGTSGSSGTSAQGSSGSDSGTASAGGTTSGGGSAKSSAGAAAGGAQAGQGAKKGPVDTACTASNSKVQVSSVSRPINHLLITLTNTSGATCNAYYAPYVGFDGDQAATQRIEESKPQAVVTLAPGEHAYASVALGGDGDHARTSRKVTVSMPGRDDAGTVGGTATLKAPGGKVYLDDNAAVSYWQNEMSDALTW